MNFDTILPRDGLCTSKWEFEFERKQDKTLLPFGTADMDFKSAQPIWILNRHSLLLMH
ncbi:TPA: hypothetical protein PIU55_005196 [Klebsiella quasipneumoniae subsp. quasipneumoniae]|nr:hypothetical protein [Klebsiella quasipneumoniae subsp. quasipneumoniae]